MTAVLVVVFLLASVAANIAVTLFGAKALVVTATVMIGLGMTVRDRLHDEWSGKGLALRMGALIAAGAALSYLVNRDAASIALASCCAFAVAESADALVYGKLHGRAWLVRTNGSNLVGALLDSLVFTTIAFGAFSPTLILMQFAAKFGGGIVWSLILQKARRS